MKALHGELAVHDMLMRANDAPYQFVPVRTSVCRPILQKSDR
ncbi:hypothetical protein [Mycetohabitans rhizoxinica]